MNRLTLKKLVFLGAGKAPAIIDFMPGFNVISGPSDTGKSLIFQCINYALGGSARPKEPPEAKGYTNIFLTIRTGEKHITLERSVLSPDVKVYDVTYDEITSNTKSTVLSGEARAKESVSKYLLEIVGIENKKLKKNESNEVVALTFNLLRRFLLVNELTIQNNRSPILSGEATAVTYEKALFRFLLTGTDYSDIIVQTKPAIRKASASARIDVLEKLISNNAVNLKKDTTKEDLQDQLEKLEASIENIDKTISINQQEIEDLQEKRKVAWQNAVTADSKIDQLNEILNRFTLLTKYYETDLDRLEAIIETGEVLSHSKGTQCPMCGSDAKYHRSECVISEKEIHKIRESCEIERSKINSLKNDLVTTINEISEDIKNHKSTNETSRDEYKRLNDLITKTLTPSILKYQQDIHKLFNTKRDVELAISLMDQIKLMEELKVEAKKELKPPPKVEKIPVGAKTTDVVEFMEIIEKILSDWEYKNLGRVGFSEDEQDITIGERNRADQGKGYRAITHAAFIISLMKYCYRKSMPHPGFVVLDSPLVTFRGADKKVQPNEAITDDMKAHFFSNLCDLQKDMQVIVLENDNPPANLLKKMNYIHFTQDEALGRYGFIPLI